MTNRTLVYVGSYAEESGPSIYVCQFNEENGELHPLQSITDFRNPTFLNVDVNHHRVYAIGETADAAGNKVGEVAAFAIDPATGELELINRKQSVASTTCHIQRDQGSGWLTVTSYHGGMIGLIAIAEDGSIGEILDVAQHAGAGKDPERQDKPHPHSSFYSPDEQYLFVQDLGMDQIVSYKVDRKLGKLQRHGVTTLHPGAGPRHLVFHPTGAFAYVINELDSTVTAYQYIAAKGELVEIATVSTLPADFTGENGCAEITISADGKFLYGSNRGHDSIVVYAINEQTGELTTIQIVKVGGGHPRHFALTPNNQFLLAANRDTNNIVTFKRDSETGMLENTGKQLLLSQPVCVIPVTL
ncbi:lactonase family protein [Paenibacillus yanchengensis]|uniref:Lactonase family protein n=1 Tax=Paenibacillus yanchengensis TaxID=2035833 RepID=A0ABW4YQQ3_9BACL